MFMLPELPDNPRAISQPTEPFATKSEGLAAFNTWFVFVRNTREVYDLRDGHRMSVHDFVKICHSDLAFHQSKSTTNGQSSEVKKLAQVWIDWPEKNQVRDYTYVPGEDLIHEGALNLWRSSGITPYKGDVSPWTRLLDHLFQGKAESERIWFEQWCAAPFQRVGLKLHTSVLLHGGQGIGKSLLTETLQMLYGPRNSATISKHQLESRFTIWAEAKQFIVCDEIVVEPKEKPVIAEKLKGLITGHRISLEGKHTNVIEAPNCFNMIFTSNSASALPIEEDDRRFFVIDSEAPPIPEHLRRDFIRWRTAEYTAEEIASAEYWGEELAPGLQALLAHLLSLDMKGFDPYASAPRTAAREEMIESDSSSCDAWLREVKEDPDSALGQPFDLFTELDLFRAYLAQGSDDNLSPASFRAAMRRMRFSRAHQYPVPVGRARHRLWVIRDADKYRGMPPSEIGRAYLSERQGTLVPASG